MIIAIKKITYPLLVLLTNQLNNISKAQAQRHNQGDSVTQKIKPQNEM